MSRHDDPAETLDPRAAAELAALDAALAGDGDDREWAALVAAVRAEPPVAGTHAARTLDERVAAGFPRRRPGRPSLPSRRRLLPALAVGASLAIGGVVIAGGTSDPRAGVSESASETGAAAGRTAPDLPSAPAASADSSAAEGATAAAPPAGAAAPATSSPPPGPTKTSDAVPPGRRSVERSATVELTTSARELQSAADAIIRATQDLGGVVERSRVDGGPAGGDADFTLRVPAARLDDALKRFGEIADVARLSEGAEDITAVVVSSRDLLADARAERKALLKALGRAETEQRISSLRARIALNRRRVAQLEADLRSLNRRAELATVNVTLQGRGAAVTTPGKGDGWGPGPAAATALRVLEVAAGVLLVAAAILVPLAVLALPLALGGRRLRRRRREAALGAG